MKNITSPLAHKVRKFANAEIGERSLYTNRLANGITSFVYPRLVIKEYEEKFKKKMLKAFPKHVSITITKPSKHRKGGIGYIRVYVSK